METYQFYKSFYDRELSRRYTLDSSINLPLTIIGILMTANTYLAKKLFPLRGFDELTLEHIFIFLFFISIAVTITYLIKSYNNFYKGFKYRNIGNYKNLREYEIKVEQYNEEITDQNLKLNFDKIVLDKIIDIAENHCTINDKRSYDLYISKTFILFSIIFTLINYLILALIK